MQEPMGLADAMMMRGLQLRNLRRLAEEDEAQRLQDSSEDFQDEIITLPNGSKLLKYESYLHHQTYYDDLKHANMKFIDYGNLLRSDLNLQLVIEQDKSLGKGGLCWDAAYILGEYLISNQNVWNNHSSDQPTKVLELGCGTGLTGMMIAKACQCHVHITDLPQLVGLMKKNMYRNFDMTESLDLDSSDEQYFVQYHTQLKQSNGSISAHILDWADPTTYPTDPMDTIIGADIVATLYDPIALVETMYRLSSTTTKLFISGKMRLDLPHEIFETQLRKRFLNVARIPWVDDCRNRNPDVFVLAISNKD